MSVLVLICIPATSTTFEPEFFGRLKSNYEIYELDFIRILIFWQIYKFCHLDSKIFSYRVFFA